MGGGEAIACGRREIGQNVMEKTETGQAIGVGGATQGVGWAGGGLREASRLGVKWLGCPHKP